MFSGLSGGEPTVHVMRRNSSYAQMEDLHWRLYKKANWITWKFCWHIFCRPEKYFSTSNKKSNWLYQKGSFLLYLGSSFSRVTQWSYQNTYSEVFKDMSIWGKILKIFQTLHVVEISILHVIEISILFSRKCHYIALLNSLFVTPV